MTTETLGPTAPATSPESASPVTAGEAPPFNGVPIADAMAQAEAAGAPVDRPLPGFEPPPYDAAGWNRKIASKNRGVASAHTAWELASDKAKNAKKILDRESKELSDLIVKMDDERRYAEGELVQPNLRAVPQGVGGSSCRYEQMEGKPCPMCILLRASGSPLPDPEDTQHYANVLDALATPDRGELLAWIDQSGQVIDEATFDAWTEAERAEVQLWCATMEQLAEGANAPARPAALGIPHVADTPGEAVQRCQGPEIAAPAPAPDGSTDGLETALAEQKVCLCEKPDFLVPVDSDRQEDARCTTCEGAPTGDTYTVRFAQAPKPTKKGKW